MTYERPSSFESIAKIEGQPEDLIGSSLLKQVTFEAFTNSSNRPGNYMIEITSILPKDLEERERVAAHLGINIGDEAIPHIPAEMSDPLIARLGFELRNSILLRPRPLGEPPARDTAHALGIGAEWWREDRRHTLRIQMSVGEAAVAEGLQRLDISKPEAHDAGKSTYQTEDLVRAVEVGRTLVAKRPKVSQGDAAAFLWPLHDNVFHLYSNILLQTPEFTEFIATHGANREAGVLDGRLAAAASQLHCMASNDWYSFTETTQTPYRQFRHFLYRFIDPETKGAVQLKEELDALEKVDKIRNKQQLDDADDALLESNRAIIDRPGNMLDQLNPVASSIIARFVRLVPPRIYL